MDVTAILKLINDEDDSAYASLLPLVYEELRIMASRLFQDERPDHTLQPTALVNEAYVKLVNQQSATYSDRRHFFAVAARAMRQILVDHARGKRASKRGGQRLKITLDEGLAASADQDPDIIAISEALTQLETLSERRARVVELRFFAGLTNQEAADVLGVSSKTTEADWYLARAWLRRALTEGQ